MNYSGIQYVLSKSVRRLQLSSFKLIKAGRRVLAAWRRGRGTG